MALRARRLEVPQPPRATSVIVAPGTSAVPHFGLWATTRPSPWTSGSSFSASSRSVGAVDRQPDELGDHAVLRPWRARRSTRSPADTRAPAFGILSARRRRAAGPARPACRRPPATAASTRAGRAPRRASRRRPSAPRPRSACSSRSSAAPRRRTPAPGARRGSSRCRPGGCPSRITIERGSAGEYSGGGKGAGSHFLAGSGLLHEALPDQRRVGAAGDRRRRGTRSASAAARSGSRPRRPRRAAACSRRTRRRRSSRSCRSCRRRAAGPASARGPAGP